MSMNVLDNYSVALRFIERFCLWLTSQTEAVELDPVDSDEDVPYDYVCTVRCIENITLPENW